MAFSYFIKVHHAGGAPARSCEGRTGPSLHPPHPWPTLYSLDEFLFIQNKLNISLFFYGCKKILGGEAEDFSITKLLRAFALAMTFQNYLVTTN